MYLQVSTIQIMNTLCFLNNFQTVKWTIIKLTQIKDLVIFVEKMKIPSALKGLQQFYSYPKQTQNN